MAEPLANPFPLEVLYDREYYKRYFKMRQAAAGIPADRVLSRLSLPDARGCITTGRSVQVGGYVQYEFGSRAAGTVVSVTQHRLIWAMTYGEWPPADLEIMHRCDNRQCCSIRHLSLGTARDNCHDMLAKGRHRTRRPLSAEERQEILRLREAGLSLNKVAELTGFCVGTISRYAPGRLAA